MIVSPGRAHLFIPFNIGCVFAASAALVLISVAPSLAQETSIGPTSGGLFGATRSDTADRNRLNFTVALSEAIDSDVPPELGGAIAPNRSQTGGYSTMLVGSTEYSHNRRRARIAGTAQTAFRYGQGVAGIEAVSHTAGLGVNVRLPGTASFQVDQSAAYSPSYLFQLFPGSAMPALGEAIPAAPDYRTVQTESYSYHTSMTLAAGSARGTSLSVSGDYDRTEFRKQSTLQPHLNGYTARGKVSQGVRRSVGLSVEYEYRTGEFGSGADSTEHRIAFGADYSRALSISRRAVFHVKVAPSTVHVAESASNPLGAGRLYRMGGEASVDYQFRRTWQASANVHRRVEYLAVLAEPIFSDAGRVSVEGLFTRRLDLVVTAGYATGASAANRESQLDSYTGNVRARFALNRSLALYTEYLYYYFDMRGYENRLPGLPALFDQHGVRVGIMLWGSAF